MDDHSFFTNLPAEITINILSRLPIKAIISCKCVNKSWLQLLQTPEFVQFHLSKLAPGIINYQTKAQSEFILTFELVDEPELDSHELHYNSILKFDIQEIIGPSTHGRVSIEGSTDGLLFFSDRYSQPEVLYICNPITRDYIVLPEIGGIFNFPSFATYGFGKSKIGGEYKVVRIFLERTRGSDRRSVIKHSKSECQVYTVGTGTWRNISPDNSHEYDSRLYGTFHDGNLHWLVANLQGGPMLISSFNLETEQFSVLSPPSGSPDRIDFFGSLTVLEHRLCLCDNTSDNEVNIWIMKEYGVERSWTKEFVVSKFPSMICGPRYEVVYALKIFKNGDILLSWDDYTLLYYSKQTKCIAKVDHIEMRNAGCIVSVLHVPSFISLKSFGMEKVKSF